MAKMTDADIRKRAIRILGNLVHYTAGRNHFGEDIERVINELRKVEADALTVADYDASGIRVDARPRIGKDGGL
jgi:hypothetical protein